MTTPTPPVTFDYAAWVLRYPEFTAVDSGYAQLCFNEAQLYCANVLRIVCNVAVLTTLLNMMTAHIVKLYAPTINGQPSTGAGTAPAPGQVGRVSNAAEGSVNVTLDMPNQPPAAAWYQQTQYGASFWAATAPYRTARYAPGNPMKPAFGVGANAPFGPFGPGYFPGRG